MAAPDWTEAHVNRLFWRAGFGARPDEVAGWTAAGRDATIAWFLNGGGGPELVGPAPHTEDGPLDPVNEWGHDVLWWLDRMVRSQRPLVEKMTLFWHDHFATRDQETPLMLAQNRKQRKHALGNFKTLTREMTTDPAMGLFLSLLDSTKWAPNENYARELMELFTLGKGYTEKDIREAARALTGFRAKWGDGGFRGMRYDREAHDTGVKKIFGKRGKHDWRDVIDLACAHRNHAPFIVGKLWSYFVAQPIDARTKARLVKIYRTRKFAIKPVVAEILRHPALYANLDRPDMVKPPLVFLAGALRTTGSPVERSSWTWLLEGMGQVPFRPPSVAGWGWGPAWLSTNTMKTRFNAVTYLFVEGGPLAVADGATPADLSPEDAVTRAWDGVGRPWVSDSTRAALVQMAGGAFSDLRPNDRRRQQRADMRDRALRHLLLSGPDAHLH
jgi:uncharacterized protein (DUF1800 family)